MTSQRLPTRVLIAFACVYFFWGSTFIAIRYGVQFLPPFALASSRYLISGVLMLAICAFRGLKLRQTPRDFLMLALLGVLMLSGGNMGLVWAEQFLPGGLAALLLACIPLYVALAEALLPRGEALRPQGWLGIAIGFGGLAVLLWPSLHQGSGGAPHAGHHQLLGSAVALAGGLFWAVGSILSRRTRLAAGPFVAAAWEMLFGGIFNFGFMLAAGGTFRVRWPAPAIMAIIWLVIFGSLVGYTAYIYLLEHVPVAKVATYAYVNPIVAVALGAVVLGERLVPIEYVGMAAILAAVYLVTSSRLRSAPEPPPTSAPEAGAPELAT